MTDKCWVGEPCEGRCIYLSDPWNDTHKQEHRRVGDAVVRKSRSGPWRCCRNLAIRRFCTERARFHVINVGVASIKMDNLMHFLTHP